MEKKTESISVFDTTFVVCDVETTGLSALQNRIIEISLIKIYNGEFVGKYATLINPQQHIPREITQLTGITNEDVFNKPTFEHVANEIVSFVSGEDYGYGTVFVGHNVNFDYKFLQESFYRLPQSIDFNIKTLCTCKLARRLLRRIKSKSLPNVAAHLGISQRKKHRAYDDSYTTVKILLHFLELLQNEYDISTTEELLKFQNTKIYSENRKSPALKRLNINLKDIPKLPGVYFMKSRSGEVIYIGKAKNLKERVSSYFHYNSEFPAKVRKLVANIHNLEYETTNSELSALILESKLIKKYKPRFNSAIKRFRYHPFLKIDVQNDYPKVEKVYEIENDGANYYGPFSSGMTVNKLLKDINDKFRLRMCEDKYLKARKDHSTCMYLDIGKCDAPCNYTMSKKAYREEVKKVNDYITSYDEHSAHNIYKSLMEKLAEQEEFEKAASVRDRLQDIEKVLSYQKVITSAINNKKIIIKCDSDSYRELFFIHNGKLLDTYVIKKENEFDQGNIFEELNDMSEYLFFSLNKYMKHKYTRVELDEIKVISNWLALNRDRNRVLELKDSDTKEDVLQFINK